MLSHDLAAVVVSRVELHAHQRARLAVKQAAPGGSVHGIENVRDAGAVDKLGVASVRRAPQPEEARQRLGLRQALGRKERPRELLRDERLLLRHRVANALLLLELLVYGINSLGAGCGSVERVFAPDSGSREVRDACGGTFWGSWCRGGGPRGPHRGGPRGGPRSTVDPDPRARGRSVPHGGSAELRLRVVDCWDASQSKRCRQHGVRSRVCKKTRLAPDGTFFALEGTGLNEPPRDSRAKNVRTCDSVREAARGRIGTCSLLAGPTPHCNTHTRPPMRRQSTRAPSTETARRPDEEALPSTPVHIYPSGPMPRDRRLTAGRGLFVAPASCCRSARVPLFFARRLRRTPHTRPGTRHRERQ
jgi:hypothetical protein